MNLAQRLVDDTGNWVPTNMTNEIFLITEGFGPTYRPVHRFNYVIGVGEYAVDDYRDMCIFYELVVGPARYDPYHCCIKCPNERAKGQRGCDKCIKKITACMNPFDAKIIHHSKFTLVIYNQFLITSDENFGEFRVLVKELIKITPDMYPTGWQILWSHKHLQIKSFDTKPCEQFDKYDVDGKHLICDCMRLVYSIYESNFQIYMLAGKHFTSTLGKDICTYLMVMVMNI